MPAERKMRRGKDCRVDRQSDRSQIPRGRVAVDLLRQKLHCDPGSTVEIVFRYRYLAPPLVTVFRGALLSNVVTIHVD
jgi:hypothetical protein